MDSHLIQKSPSSAVAGFRRTKFTKNGAMSWSKVRVNVCTPPGPTTNGVCMASTLWKKINEKSLRSHQIPESQEQNSSVTACFLFFEAHYKSRELKQ